MWVSWHATNKTSSRKTCANGRNSLKCCRCQAFRGDFSEFHGWKLRLFNDGEQAYIQFPARVAQGELSPLFVIGAQGNGYLFQISRVVELMRLAALGVRPSVQNNAKITLFTQRIMVFFIQEPTMSYDKYFLDPTIQYFVMNLLAAVLLLVLGWIASMIAGHAVRKLLLRIRHIDPTIIPAVQRTSVWLLRLFVLIALLAHFGFQTASLIAVLGTAGVTIGLALQNTLQNVAAGMMLLVLRPLRAGEIVSVVGKADGTVDEIGLFLTRLTQADGTTIWLPNSLIWGNPIINYSRKTAALRED